ncbi:MAG: glycosyltransferase family 39 protein [Nitrospinae bacterium]|nr:glycosyltransferase family 39 protein [Nitrospinota bacterium]
MKGTQSKSHGRTISRTSVLLLAVVLAAALALRLLHLYAVSQTAFVDFHQVFTASDMHTNWQWAKQIAAGDWLGRPPYHPFGNKSKRITSRETWERWWGGPMVFKQSPLYPYLVGSVIALGGERPIMMRLLQVLLGVLDCWLLYAIGRRLGGHRAGLFTAGLGAVYAPYIFYSAIMLRDILLVPLQSGLLLSLLRWDERPTGGRALFAGALLGLCLLAKEVTLLLVLLLAAWGVWKAVRGGAAQRRTALGIVLGFALSVSPLVARNIAVGAPALALSNRFSTTFIQSFAADGHPVGLTYPNSTKAIMEASEGHTWPVVRETLKTYGDDVVGGLLRNQAIKLRALASPLEIPNNVNFYYGRELSAVLRATLPFGLLLPIGLVGLALGLAPETRRRFALIWLFTLFAVGALLGSFVLSRYRLPLAGALIPAAGYALAWMVERARAGALHKVGGAVAAYGLLTIVVYFTTFHLSLTRPTDYFVAARIYQEREEYDRAAAEIERLLGNIQGDRRYWTLDLYARRRLWEINFLRDLERAVEAPSAKPAPPSAGDRR